MTSAHPVMVPPRARGPVLVMFSIKSNLRKDSCSEFGVGKKTRGSRVDTHMHVNTEEALIRHQQPWDARQGGRARGELRPASGARNRKPMAPSAVPATGPAGPGGAARHRPIRHARWASERRGMRKITGPALLHNAKRCTSMINPHRKISAVRGVASPSLQSTCWTYDRECSWPTRCAVLD
jgi:hypothetical protein